MKKITLGAFSILMLTNCSTNPPAERQTASKEEVRSRDTWLYTWTSSKVEDPRQFVKNEIQIAKDCILKFQKSNNTVLNCEGSGFKAGPGLYLCDNPFTSHDYGNVLVYMKSNPDKTNLTYYPDGGPADVMDRVVYGNPKTSAIVYDFRYSPISNQAVVVRDSSIIVESTINQVNLKNIGFKKFSEHSSYKCDSKTSVEKVFTNWGDHLEFLSITFADTINYNKDAFYGSNKLTDMGLIASISSDLVGDGNLEKTIPTYIQKYNLEESLSRYACGETHSRSMKSCLARRIFDSINNNIGTERSPTYSWDLKTTVNFLMDQKIITLDESKKINSNQQLITLLSSKIRKNANQMARIEEAYKCMVVVKEKSVINNLETWVTK